MRFAGGLAANHTRLDLHDCDAVGAEANLVNDTDPGVALSGDGLDGLSDEDLRELAGVAGKEGSLLAILVASRRAFRTFT